jgi:hypothetical protein
MTLPPYRTGARWGGLTVILVLAVLFAGCGDDGGVSTTVTTGVATTTTTGVATTTTTHAPTTTTAAPTTTTTAATTTTTTSPPVVTGTHEVSELAAPFANWSAELGGMIGTAPFEAGKVTLLTGERHLSDPRLDGLAEATILDCVTPAAGSADEITCAGVSSTWDEDGTWESTVTVHIAADGSMVWEVASVGTEAYAGLAWTDTERGSGMSFEVSGRVEERPGSGLLVEPVGSPPPGATPITGPCTSYDPYVTVGPYMTDPTHERGKFWETEVQASDPRVSGRQIELIHVNRSGTVIPVWGVEMLLVEPGKSWYGLFWMTVTSDLHVLDAVYTGFGEYAGLEYHSDAEGYGHTWHDGGGWIDEAD